MSVECLKLAESRAQHMGFSVSFGEIATDRYYQIRSLRKPPHYPINFLLAAAQIAEVSGRKRPKTDLEQFREYEVNPYLPFNYLPHCSSSRAGFQICSSQSPKHQ